MDEQRGGHVVAPEVAVRGPARAGEPFGVGHVDLPAVAAHHAVGAEPGQRHHRAEVDGLARLNDLPRVPAREGLGERTIGTSPAEA